MTLDRSPGFVLGALFSQLADRTDFLGCPVIKAFPLCMQSLPLEQVSGRAPVCIALRVIEKHVIGKYGTFLRPLERRSPQVGHMGLNAPIVASKKVVNGAVLTVGNNSFNCYTGCGLMLLHERHHTMCFINVTGGCFGCRDDLAALINSPMDLV